MESIRGNICSICSQVFYSSERKIDIGDVLQILKHLTNVNCSALQKNQVCERCLNNIHDACNFKMLYMEKKVLNVGTKIEQIDPEIFCICQICKEIIEKSSSASYTNDLKLVIYHLMEGIRRGLEEPENSHICISCRESVVNFHSVIKLLSNFDEERISNVKSEDESLDTENKIEIKKEPLMEYLNTAVENSVLKNEPVEINDIKNDIKTESRYDNAVNLTYKDFIMKNEEMDIKSEYQECNFTEQMWNVGEEHSTKTHLNLTHLTVDQKNNKKASKPVETCDIRKFACDVCDYKSKQKRYLKNHMLRHMRIHKNIEDSEIFICDICGCKTKLKIYLERHMLKHNHKNVETEIFTCYVCGHKIKGKGNVKSHMLKHKNVEEIELFSCNVCEYQTKRQGNLKSHMLKHKKVDEIEMFACDICSYNTKYKSALIKHMHIHKNIEDNEVLICDVCGFKTQLMCYLKKHMLKHNHKNVETEIYTCHVCGHKIKGKGNLKNHMLKHKNVGEIEMFSCNVCEYKAKRKGNLKSHMLTHMNVDEIEMFTCDICGHKTKRKDKLIKHMKIHKSVDEIEMFSCNVCKYKAKQQGNLKSHMLKHKKVDETEMFACDICEYKAKRKGNIKSHMLTHMNVDEIEMFTCNI